MDKDWYHPRPMARPPSVSDDLDDLGVLITAAHGLDRSWVDEASCLQYAAGLRDDELNPWYAEWNRAYGDIRGSEYVKAALMICHGCPAQYDCARYAVRGRMVAGTWGMTLSLLRWLQGRDDALEIIDVLEANGVALYEGVAEFRADEVLALSVA